MKEQLLAGLQTSTGLPFRRLTFVPAQRPDAQSATPGVDLIPLNDPQKVCINQVMCYLAIRVGMMQRAEHLELRADAWFAFGRRAG